MNRIEGGEGEAVKAGEETRVRWRAPPCLPVAPTRRYTMPEDMPRKVPGNKVRVLSEQRCGDTCMVRRDWVDVARMKVGLVLGLCFLSRWIEAAIYTV
jgi:hypothetical protein